MAETLHKCLGLALCDQDISPPIAHRGTIEQDLKLTMVGDHIRALSSVYGQVQMADSDKVVTWVKVCYYSHRASQLVDGSLKKIYHIEHTCITWYQTLRPHSPAHLAPAPIQHRYSIRRAVVWAMGRRGMFGS